MTGDSQDFSREESDIAAHTPEFSRLKYQDIPCSESAESDDEWLELVRKWHQDLKRPAHLSDPEYKTFLRYCVEFFIDEDQLWRKDSQGAHKLVAPLEIRVKIMADAHDNIGHKSFYATCAIIFECFWWPHMQSDIHWFVRTCHNCQLRQTCQLLIPPVVATPASLFAKVYIDTMHMLPSTSFKYIVQGRCSLTQYPEFRKLRSENAKALGDWIFEDIICRWGSLQEIVTDNGSAFLKALEYLAKKYHITHIRISGYNSHANGLVEHPHFDVRQSLFKAVDGDQK
jgi:hypothetical protein